MQKLVLISVSCALIVGSAACRSPVPPVAASTQGAARVYEFRSPGRDGIGKIYMGREISQVLGHAGGRWLERDVREAEEQPALLVEHLELAPDAVVADIGAGSGYLTFRISPLVPQGKVLAVDIQPEMLDLIEQRSAERGVSNVETLFGRFDTPMLPEAGVDVVLMVDAYHEFSHPREMGRGIVEGLKPGGRVVIVEYRAEDPDVPIKPLHKMTEQQVRLELEALGLRWVETKAFLPRQHFMVFRKP